MSDPTKRARKLWGLYMDEYDSGGTATTVAFLEAAITPEAPAKNLLLYPTVNSLVKFNTSAKEVFLPAETWTPIGFTVGSFNVKTVEGAGHVYWQGWY